MEKRNVGSDGLIDEEPDSRCSWCGTDPEEVCDELNLLQVLIEGSVGMKENQRLRALDRIYEIRHLVRERTNIVRGPWLLGV